MHAAELAVASEPLLHKGPGSCPWGSSSPVSEGGLSPRCRGNEKKGTPQTRAWTAQLPRRSLVEGFSLPPGHLGGSEVGVPLTPPVHARYV